MERLGKYEIISEIGRGAMGSVYKARDPLIGRNVALKTITSGMSSQANSLERFYQEARSAGALQHPNIVIIYELGQENGVPFIAMEFIEGESLDHLIESRQPLPLSVKLGYIVHVCEALSHAHQHNVIHRDVKPANIMVTKEGVIKVVDFGIARLTDMSLTQPNMMIGSRAYMSPQLYEGKKADARSDIWAVGVTLYELLAGQRPFSGDSEAELMFRIMRDKPAPLPSLAPECSSELATIIDKMLEKNVEDRYQSTEDALRDLEPFWKTAQQATVAGLLADCQQLVQANDLQRAQGLLRKALKIDTANTQAKSLMERVTAELRRNQILPRIKEHVERGRGFLQTGKLREARAEVEAALGLDSRHDPAQKLRADLESALARAQEVEQKLRLTKQRLAEGALTEAAEALGRALEIDQSNPQAQELQRQIEDEKARREKRKKLSETLHHARTLWTALNYEECLQTLAEGLREFPNEPELIKLRDMTRHDLADLEKQKQLGEVRRLLGQQDYVQATKIVEALAARHPLDSAVTNLQNLVLDGEREQQKTKRLTQEMTGLRALLTGGEYAKALAKGKALLREYPEEFELKEIVDYAQGEAAQQEQRLQEKSWEKQITGLMEMENFKEAEALANRAAQQLPKADFFRKAADEAREKRALQEQSERARRDLKRRIQEIHGKLQQEKLGDAIHLAEETLIAFGPNADVTQLLNSANAKHQEQQRKEQQEWHLAESKTKLSAGDFAGATQLLDQAMATHIFERSDPRVQERLQEIEVLKSGTVLAAPTDGKLAKPASAKSKAAGASASQAMFTESSLLGSATQAGGSGTASPPATSIDPAAARRSAPPARATSSGTAAVQAKETHVGTPGRTESNREAQAPAVVAFLRKPVAWAALGGLLVVIVAVSLFAVNRGPSKKEKELRDRASQLWNARQFDDSEQAWRELQALHGSLQNDAAKQIQDIDSKREQESQRFQQGESLMSDQNGQPDYKGAAQIFDEVANMKLWLADKAVAEAERAKGMLDTDYARQQEKLHFSQGKAFFDARNYDQARQEFELALGLNVPDSTLRPEIDNYLRKIAQNGDTRRSYENALNEMKKENWDAAGCTFQELIDHKSPLSGEAKKRLDDVAAVQKIQDDIHREIQSGAYSTAKTQLDGMQKWPKTQQDLRTQMESAERQEVTNFESRSKSLQSRQDVAGMEALQAEVRRFEGRTQNPTFVDWAKKLDAWLSSEEQTIGKQFIDRKAFDDALQAFNNARQDQDAGRLQNEVLAKFQSIAKAPGPFQSAAQGYVDKNIPAAVKDIREKLGNGVPLPAISCGGAAAPPTGAPSLAKANGCAQLDADSPLQWIGRPTMEPPPSANQPGKLPYTLQLMVFVDATGKVSKVEKIGEADKDFFKKAKESSKTWKTTAPKSGGKAVSVSFPIAITFR